MGNDFSLSYSLIRSYGMQAEYIGGSHLALDGAQIYTLRTGRSEAIRSMQMTNLLNMNMYGE